jgi:hypothetical protein
MNPAEILQALRDRGFNVAAKDGRLVVKGPTPKDAERATETLRQNKPALLELLNVEQHPKVVAALEVFPGARLAEVRRGSR